jgi:hypothetical protein
LQSGNKRLRGQKTRILLPAVINKSRQNQTGSAKTGGSAKKGGSQASDLQTTKRRHPSMAERHASIVKNDLAHD